MNQDKVLQAQPKWMIAGSVLFLIAAIVSTVFGAIALANQGDFGWDNIMAIIYMGFHIIIVFFGIILFAMQIKRKKSVIMRTLMYKADYKDEESPVARGVAIGLASLGLLIAILGILGLTIPTFYFAPLALFMKLDLANAGLYLAFIAINFLLYPIFNKGNKQKLETPKERR